MNKLIRYKKTFVGGEAIDYFLSTGMVKDRADGTEFGTMLMKRHFFHPLYGQLFVDSNAALYRFLEDEDLSPLTLNLTSSTYDKYLSLSLSLPPNYSGKCIFL